MGLGTKNKRFQYVGDNGTSRQILARDTTTMAANTSAGTLLTPTLATLRILPSMPPKDKPRILVYRATNDIGRYVYRKVPQVGRPGTPKDSTAFSITDYDAGSGSTLTFELFAKYGEERRYFNIYRQSDTGSNDGDSPT